MNRFMEKLGLKNLQEGLGASFIKSEYEASELLDGQDKLLGFSLIGEFVFKKAGLADLVDSLNEIGRFDEKFWNFKFDDFKVQLFISEDGTIVFHSNVLRPQGDDMIDFFALGIDLGTAISRARILLSKSVEKSILKRKKNFIEIPSPSL